MTTPGLEPPAATPPRPSANVQPPQPRPRRRRAPASVARRGRIAAAAAAPQAKALVFGRMAAGGQGKAVLFTGRLPVGLLPTATILTACSCSVAHGYYYSGGGSESVVLTVAVGIIHVAVLRVRMVWVVEMWSLRCGFSAWEGRESPAAHRSPPPPASPRCTRLR